jgi:signal transduction histidine kinase
MVSQLAENQRELVEARKAVGMGRLVAGIAHEINTPIGISITSVSFLEDQLKQTEQSYKDGKLSSKGFESMLGMAGESLSLIHRNLDRSAYLVKYFKMLSVTPKPENWSQYSLLDVLGQVKEKLDVTRSGYCEILYKGEAQAYGDQVRVIRLLTMLTNNAFEHAYKGKEQGEVYLSAEDHADHVKFIVEDKGVGIAPELKQHMFDPFVSSEERTQSTGLGLNIANNIATQALFGKIECETEEGLFTRFIITIPKDFREKI